jgi:hypothetical protein
MISFILQNNMKNIWKIWCKTMGEKISEDKTQADIAALIRTFWWFMHIITCFFIISGVIRHW